MLVGLSLKSAPSLQLAEPETADRPKTPRLAPLDLVPTPAVSVSAPCKPSSERSPVPKAKKAASSKCRTQIKQEKPIETASCRLVTAFKASEHTEDSRMYVRSDEAIPEARSAGDRNLKDWRRVVAEQWKIVRSVNGEKQENRAEQAKSDAIQAASQASKKEDHDATAKRKSGFFKGFFPGRGGSEAKTESLQEAADFEKPGNSNSAALVPQTFEDMARFNAMMIGSNMSWIGIVIDAFDHLVASVVNNEERRLEKETRILALRIHREGQGTVFLNEYKVCMLAALRSLLPKIWDLESEAAWAAMWDTVQTHLEPMLPLPARYEKPVEKFFSALSDSERRSLGMAVFEHLFKIEPKSENYFLQSNDRLCYIVQRAFGFSTEVYQTPKETVDAITYLGLKHIMYGIPEQYFEPFVACCLEELRNRCEDADTLDGFEWSMRLVQSIMVQAIEDGSTPLLKAVLKNDPRGVRRELAKMPRGQRAAAALGGM